MEEIRTIQTDVDYKNLQITGGNKVTYDFSDYKTFKELFRDLYYRKMTIDDAELKQDEFFRGREKIIKGFKDGIFPLNHDDVVEEKARSEEEEKNIRNENDLIDYKKFGRLINLKERDISDELVRKHFLVQDLGALLEKMKKLKKIHIKIEFR